MMAFLHRLTTDTGSIVCQIHFRRVVVDSEMLAPSLGDCVIKCSLKTIAPVRVFVCVCVCLRASGFFYHCVCVLWYMHTWCTVTE